MSKVQKRVYTSSTRSAQASETRMRILVVAKNLFATEGFTYVTIEKIALAANVSIPTIYSLFQSKCGVLRALMDEVFPKEDFEALVEKSHTATSPQERLLYSAKIARQIYDAERTQTDIFRTATVLAPAFKELEKEREMRRYARQERTIQAMVDERSLAKHVSPRKARDILWALTGRDMYRMFVIEQGWTSEEYETWLAEFLIKTLC